MRTVGILSQKGGVGKTTTAVNLAGCLAESGKRVLLIDMDSAGSASKWCGMDGAGEGLAEVLAGNGDLEKLVRSAGRFDVVPAGIALAGAERQLAKEVGADVVLRDLLARLPDQWDWILIDAPPQLGILSVNILAAVGEVLVPTELSVLALGALEPLFRTIETVRKRLNPEIEVLGLVAVKVDMRTVLARQALEQLRGAFDGKVLDTKIRHTVRLAECPTFKKPIVEYDPESGAAADYRQLAAEIQNRRRP